MLKTILKALCILTLAGLMLLSPLPSAQAANTSSYYIALKLTIMLTNPFTLWDTKRTLEYHHQISKVLFYAF